MEGSLLRAMVDLENLRRYFHKYHNQHWMMISATLLGLLGINNLAISHGHDHSVSAANDYVRQDNQAMRQSTAFSAANHTASQLSGLNMIARSASNMSQSIANNSTLPQSDVDMFNSLTRHIQSSALSLGSQISTSASASASASVAKLQQSTRASFNGSNHTYSVPNYNPGGSLPATRVAMFNHDNEVVWHDGARAINLKRRDVKIAQVLSSIHSGNEVVYVTSLNGKVGYVYGSLQQRPQPLYLKQRYVYLSVNHQVMNVNTSNLVDSRIIETIHYANSDLVKYCVSTKYGIGYIYVNLSSAKQNSAANPSDENKENYPVPSSSKFPAATDVNESAKMSGPHYTNDQKIDILRSQINSLIQVVQSDQKRIDSLLNLLHR